MVHGEGEYWATTDVIDEQGSGHLELAVASASSGSPPTLAELQQNPEYHHDMTGAERHQPDGSVITTCTETTSDARIENRAILARPDGTDIDVRSSNEDARAGDRTRPTPPLDAETVLDKIADLRP